MTRKKILKANQGGFTLIETIIYIALTSLIIGSGVVTAFYVADSSESEKTKLYTATETSFLLRKIDWVLDGVDAINVPAAGSTSSTLSVNKKGYAANPLVIDAMSGRARLKQGSGMPIELTSDRVMVQNLSFTHIPAAAPKPAAIQMNFTADGQTSTTTRYLHL